MSILTEAQREQFRTDGYCVLDNVVPDAMLRLLRDECATFIRLKDEEMDRAGTDTLGISHRGSRYFVSNCHLVRPEINGFLHSELMAGICRDTLGPDAYMFYNQYVVKGAEAGMKFSWHQDSGYVNANGGDIRHRAYLTTWTPLDDVTEENGTIYVLPQSELGIRTWVAHEKDPKSNDWVGYFGAERGVPVIIPAGSMAIFSSMTFHCSGANRTHAMRRVFLAQYSPEPILRNDGSIWANAVPVLKDGKRVGEPVVA